MALKSFIEYLLLEKKYSKHTVTAYQNDLEKFKAFVKETYGTDDTLHVNYSQIRH